MANMRLMFPSASDDGSISASSEASSSLAAANLLSPKRNKLWRSSDLTDQILLGDFDELKNVMGLVLARNNISANGSVRARIYEAAGQTGALLFDSGILFQGDDPGYGEWDYGIFPYGGTSVYADWAYSYTAMWNIEAVTAASYRIDISDPANSAGYIEASRLYMGEYFSPDVNISRGLSMEWVDNTEQFRSAGGSLESDTEMEMFRRWEMRLGTLTQTERSTLLDIFLRAGKSQDMFLAGAPEIGAELGTEAAEKTERDYSGLVKITSMPRFINRIEDWTKYETALTFEES